MATVQANPAMQAGPAGLPPNLTPQQVQETYQKFKRMQEMKTPPTDPEYIKAHRLLSAVQQNQAFRKMQQQQHQMQAQQRAHASSQNQAEGPAFSLHMDGANGMAAKQEAAPAANGQQPQTNGTTSANKSVSSTSQSFTPEQLFVLKNQIQAFRLLSRNLTIPANIQKQLFPSKKPSTQPDGAMAAPPQPEPTSAPQTDGTASPAPASKTWYETYVSPFDSLAPSISFADHAMRSKRPRIPALLPSGVDIDEVREERERILYNRVQARKAELGALPANVGVWDTSKSDEARSDDSTKLKALIEYKMLSLLQKQRDFRKEIQHELFTHDNLAMTANRSLHRRLKKQSLREAKITEKLEKQQRDARESKERKKQSDHLQAIIHHGRELQTNASSQHQRQHRLGRMMIAHHQHMEREEQKRIERTAKQRLQALKANDEETYMKLLGQAKDSRISHLLNQTDGFLKQLAASVRAQQRSQQAHYGEDQFEDEEEEEEDEVDSEDESGGRKVDYDAIAHRIKESVTVQPSILVGGTLKEYQVKGLQWMISLYNNNLNGILADEMGLGKTIQTISLITYLVEHKKQSGPFLVIVPLSTLTNWNLEFEKWAPSISKIVYKGPPMARKQQQNRIRYGQFQVLLTTYEYIIKDRPILSKIKWLHMIVDEGHRMKNASSKLSSTLTTYYTSRYRLILTGTPLQNNLPELWALLNFVLPTIFKSVKSFDEWFNTPFANTGGQDKMELSEEEQILVIRRLHKVLRPFLLRRLKKDVEKDLPDKQERVVKCRFSALQAKLYKQLVTHNKLAVTDGKGGKTGMRGLSNMLMQLRKLCNHPFVFEAVEDQMNPGRYTNDTIWRTAGKFELLDRILPKFKASGHRVLMFFQMTQIMNIMEDFLRLKDMKYLRLDGSTKADDRSDLLKLFNAPGSDYFCFLLSTRAGGLGLNLQTADTVIIYDSDWNPHQDLQAQDRAHRIGQKNEVRILRLISSNSVEEKILERAQYKLDMDGKVIQAGRFDNKSTNEERDAMLRTLLETAEAADDLVDQEEMDDDDLNDIMARSEAESELFAKMDKDRSEQDEYGPGREFGRLMGESELPDIYLSEENPAAVEEVEEYAGRGARERKVMKYDDGLTEEQWLMAVDADDDTIEDAVARKQARIDKRRNNKEVRERKGLGGESSPEVESEEEEPQPKKRGRKPGPPKRKAEEIIEEEPPKRKRGRQAKVQETLSSGERTAVQKVLKKVYETLSNLEVEDSDASAASSDSDDGPVMRAVIPPFLVRPDKRMYPDYYQLIQNPIAMDMIQKRIDSSTYQSLREFQKDVHLLCTNARTYNEDNSPLWKDANLIQKTCDDTLSSEASKYPQLSNFSNSTDIGDDQASSSAMGLDGQSTIGAGSGANTPLPPGSSNGPGPSSTKLRLTFNGNGGSSRAASHGVTTNGTDSGIMSGDED